MGLAGPGLDLRCQRQAEHDAVLLDHGADRVETLPVELEEVLEVVFVGGGRHGDHRPRRLGGLGELQPRLDRGQIGLEGGLVADQGDGQMEDPALQPCADHQPPGMLDAEGLGLLLEVDDVDVHGVEAEGQRQFDELAGATGEGEADGAEIAEHA